MIESACITILVVISTSGCGNAWHRSTPVTFEVVDALSGEPASGVVVSQQVVTGKFERALWKEAKTDDRGVTTFQVIGDVPQSYWSVGMSGPTYDGVGRSQIPSEFQPLESAGAIQRYVAPMWPAMELRIELPIDYRGLVIEWPLALDAPRSSGWVPPAHVADNAVRVATARADTNGVVAYPAIVDRLAGFEFVPERTILLGTQPLSTIGCNVKKTGVAAGAPAAWEIGYGDGDWITTPQGRGAVPARPLVWFVGTESDLRTWLGERSMRLITARSHARATDPAEWRFFVRADVFAGRDTPTEPTDSPAWSTRVLEAR